MPLDAARTLWDRQQTTVEIGFVNDQFTSPTA
jgi:hypothetical protein